MGDNSLLVACTFVLAVLSFIFIVNLPTFFTSTEIQILISIPIILLTLGLIGAMKDK